MQKPSTTRTLVSEDERVRYVENSICLTIWYGKEREIIAFEVIFGLIVDEWAFLYHRKGSSKYCKVDDGENRIGRPQKQAMSGLYDLPNSRVEEFGQFDGQLPDKDKNFVLNKMKEKRVK